MSEKITKIDSAQFDSLTRTMSGRPQMFFFSAEWNAQCRMLRPILLEAAEKYGSKIDFFELDTDDAPETAAVYGIQNVPTLLTLRNGQMIDLSVGLTTRDKLKEKIEKMLAPGVLYRSMAMLSKKFAVGLAARFGA